MVLVFNLKGGLPCAGAAALARRAAWAAATADTKPHKPQHKQGARRPAFFSPLPRSGEPSVSPRNGLVLAPGWRSLDL